MLMRERERPFSGGGRALPEQRWSRVFSRIPDLGGGGGNDQQGRGASGVREVNLAGIP